MAKGSVTLTPKVRQQLIEYINIPAVLVTKDDVPYEFKGEGSINRLKNRRQYGEIPFDLYRFLLEHGVTKDQLREFASGFFLNYVETQNIYV